MAITSWPRIPATTLADQVYEVVRTRILHGRVAPGEFIREKDLNDATGVSRTPIREALSRLASEGYLERIPHRGYRVPEEPLGDLLELYPVISALDLLAGRLALPRLSTADIAELKQTNADLYKARDAEDVEALIELNNRFHHLFSERSGNRRLNSLLDDLRLQLSRLERWYYSDRQHTEESLRQHAEIIQAIETGDDERVLSVLERNMALTYTALLEEVEVRNGE
jgi:DNA-binding GntR family transcriptional regulator